MSTYIPDIWMECPCLKSWDVPVVDFHANHKQNSFSSATPTSGETHRIASGSKMFKVSQKHIKTVKT